MTRSLLILLLAGAGVLPLSHAYSDHNRARAAMVVGDILPLKQILERVEGQRPGQVLEVELDQENGVWVYEILQLQSDGRLVKLDVDARTGQITRERLHGQDRR